MSDTIATDVVAPPEPLSMGTYALFQTPKGGLHLVYRPKGSPEDVHMEIPAFVVSMAQKMANGETNPVGIAKMLGM